MKHILLTIAVFLFTLQAVAEEKLVVLAGAVCPLEVAKNEAARMARGSVAVNPACRPLPAVVPIVKVHSGPYRDWEGDSFFIVQVDEAVFWFTFAWPGHNSNMPKTSGA